MGTVYKLFTGRYGPRRTQGDFAASSFRARKYLAGISLVPRYTFREFFRDEMCACRFRGKSLSKTLYVLSRLLFARDLSV